MYTINVYNGRGDFVESHSAGNELDAVSTAYRNVQGLYNWVAHILKDGTHSGIYIARWDDFSARNLQSLELAADRLAKWAWNGDKLSPELLLKEGRY